MPNDRSVKESRLETIGRVLILISVVGIILVATQTINVPDFGKKGSQVVTTSQQSENLTFVAGDENLRDLVLGGPNIIPSSITVASLEPTYELRIVFYELEDRSQIRKNGYRIYDHLGEVLYEDNSSLWSATPTYWRTVHLGDYDQDGREDVFVEGTVAGTGAHLRIVVLGPSRRGGFAVLSDETLIR